MEIRKKNVTGYLPTKFKVCTHFHCQDFAYKLFDLFDRGNGQSPDQCQKLPWKSEELVTYKLGLKYVPLSIANILLINYLPCLTIVMDKAQIKVKSYHINQKKLLLVSYGLSL